MKRNGSKSLSRKRSTTAKLKAEKAPKRPRRSQPAANERAQMAQAKRVLERLFKIGDSFKGIDTETIIRVAEDKDLEYT